MKTAARQRSGAVAGVVTMLIGMAIGVASPGQAQTESKAPALPALSGKPLVVDADTVVYDQDKSVIKGTGHVRVDYQGVVLHADYVEAQVQAKQIIATGNVSLEHQQITLRGAYLTYDFVSQRGALLKSEPEKFSPSTAVVDVLYQDQRIEADRIDFDLALQEAVASSRVTLYQGPSRLTGENLRYNFQTKQTDWSGITFTAAPWFGKAAQADRKSPELVEFTTASVTTCDHVPPHYRVQAQRIEYYVDDRIVAHHARLYLGSVPVLYVPVWKQSLADTRPKFTVRVGNKTEWGWFALGTYRYQLNEYVKGRIHLDERAEKGFASGIDADYTTKKNGQGSIKTYYMNERDTSHENPSENAPEQERYRTQLKHRWQVDPTTLALAEYNKLSDSEFTKDYLYREYAADAQPVTEASLSHAESAYTVGAYARLQTNPFYSEVERLPEATFKLNSQSLADTQFYYRTDVAAASLNKKTANSAVDAAANRLDTYQELKYPTRLPGGLDWINFAPYVATRQTFYSKDALGTEEDFWRGIYYYGGEMTTQFYRISAQEGSFLGTELHQLRHVVTPTVQYSFINTPTVPAEKLIPFDEIDAITAQNLFTLGVQNHVQTKWRTAVPDEWERVDLIYFYPHVQYYPGLDSAGRYFSLITTEFNVKPQRWLAFYSDSEFDQYKRRFQSAQFDMALERTDRWRLSLGKRYDRDTSDQTTGDLFMRLNDLWQARVYGRYEAYTDRFQEQQYTITRDLHCWLLDVTYAIKRTEDGSTQDRTFWFTFRLKAFPDETPLSLNVGYDTVNRR